MNISDAYRLLAVAAVYDARKPSDTVAQQWAADLADVNLADAISAVREHYTHQPDTWVKAGHVLSIVKRNRRRRLDRSWLAEADALRRSDPDDVGRYLAELRRAREGIAMALPNGRPALPAGKYDADAARVETNRRGAERARKAIAKTTTPKPRRPERDAVADLRELTPGPDWDPGEQDGGDAA